MLESSKVNWDSTPFRFENMWLSHHSFIPFVKEIWNTTSVEGLEGVTIMRKLKLLKEKIERVE